MMKLENKVAIVTGSGRGIGKETAVLLAKEGCSVVITARTHEEINETAKEIIKNGGVAFAVKADMCNSKDVRSLVKKTISKLGTIDILVNNAGILIKKPLIETSEKEWDSLIDTNLKGAFLCTKEVLPFMTKQKSGTIVNISSGAGRRGVAGLAAYCASKFGVIGLTESVAKEAVKDNVRVYAICPGLVATQMQVDLIGAAAYKISKMLMIQPSKIAGKVLELCLPDCKIPTGSSVEIYNI